MAILAVLKSGAVGSFLGFLGGMVQKYQDLALKKVEFEHELALRRVDIEIMDREIAGKERIASIETEGKVEAAQFDAMSEGYKGQFTGGGKIDAVSRIVRPFVTIYFLIVSSVMSFVLVQGAYNSGVQFTVDQWREWLSYVLEWTFFQAGVMIAWWFAVRSSSQPKFPGKR